MAVLLLSLQTRSHSGEPAIQVGDRFPDLRKHSIEGDLPATLQGKVVVVDFWASWCGPCKESFSVMEELHLRFSEQGLVILAVNVDESRAAMEEFLKEHPVRFNVVRDAKKSLVRAVNIQSMPSSYILDTKGRVHAIYHGFHTMETRKKYVREIKELLKAESSKGTPIPP